MPTGSQEAHSDSRAQKQVTPEDLRINPILEIERISARIRETLVQVKRRGAVIGLSGGVDSSVTAALCAKAVGNERVLGILMPERHSATETSSLGKQVAEVLGIKALEHDITSILDSTMCYEYQHEAVRAVIPDYVPGTPFKIILPRMSNGYRIFSLVLQMPDGSTRTERMSHEAYLKLVAATNFKQRVRKMIEYFHADRLNYVVAGSPNRLEYDQGFFVKNGDGSADIKPIAHLYKSQVYQLAEQLGIPEVIRNRPPTTDTYPMEQSQEEFYFSLPYNKMDLCLYAKNKGLGPMSICDSVGLTPQQCETAFNEIENKRKTTQYLHLKPLLVDKVPEITTEL